MEDCRSTITCFKNKVTSEDVEKWFLKAGGVARTVLKLSSEGLTLEAQHVSTWLLIILVTLTLGWFISILTLEGFQYHFH
jgi:hypothetical protein